MYAIPLSHEVEQSKKLLGPATARVSATARKRPRKEDFGQESLVENFLCPISLSLPADPVVGSDGRLYERTEIERWLATRGTSPVTQAPMAAESLASCHPVRNAIEALVSSGAVSPDEEALFQIRRGSLAKVQGDRRTAMNCFRRATELGNSDAKYFYAIGLLEEAAPSCTQAAQLLNQNQPFSSLAEFKGHYCTTFCDELIEVRDDGVVLFNSEWHPDNIIRRKPDNGRFCFNQWELDAEASRQGRLLWLRPTANRADTNSRHRIWWFAYTAAAPPNCYEQRASDSATIPSFPPSTAAASSA